ncbi:MAG: aminopeptidase [Clostridia bacterium]|nr:aminopeptidase [Clostridia bacterium]
MNEEKISEYARLAVEVGVNLQKGQTLMVCCPVENAFFARKIADCAYERGAKDVIVDWRDDYISRKHWLYADDSLFDRVYPWDADKRNTLAKEGAAYIFICGDDPENLKGVNGERIRRWETARGRDLKEFLDLETSNGFPWCVISAPVKSWADKVFPGEENSLEKLWEAVFAAVRINGDGTAPEKWKEHCKRLESLCEKLNGYNFKSLHYKNSLGTDLTVEMPENHLWLGGGDTARSGVRFVANMPTEEVFCAPLKTGVNGTLCASMPLAYNGNIIEGIRFTFKDGRITEVHADKGEGILKGAVDTDEGSHYLGEIALVPYDSPISNTGILFYETLFDENASCHFAFGQAYSASIKGGDYMSAEELLKAGINAESCTHTDFMVGSADLSIVGTTHDGEEITVFENGNFAI